MDRKGPAPTTTRTRVVACLGPALLENVNALALRRNDSKAPVAE